MRNIVTTAFMEHEVVCIAARARRSKGQSGGGEGTATVLQRFRSHARLRCRTYRRAQHAYAQQRKAGRGASPQR